MMHGRRLLLALAMVMLGANCWAADAVIVCPQQDARLVKAAAQEVRRYIFVRTGKLLDISPTPTPSNHIVVATKDWATAEAAEETGAASLEPQDYLVKSSDKGLQRCVYIIGGSESSTLYAAYRFAELMGVRFFMHGDVAPDERMAFSLPTVDERHSPLFDTRGIQPFHDFAEGPDWWTTEDYKAIIGQLPKMGMNFIGLHTYFGEPEVWTGLAEDVNDDGTVKSAYPAAWCTTTISTGWGFSAKKTSDYALGASQLFDRDSYGSDAMRGFESLPQTPEDCATVFNRAGAMLRDAFTWAHGLGIKTCVGTETPLAMPGPLRDKLVAEGVIGKADKFEAVGGKNAQYASPIEDTEDDALYQNVRYDLKGYVIPAPDGEYKVTLKFCEVAYDTPGVRVFDVLVQDKTVIEGLDIFARVGKNRALDFAYDGVKVEGGKLMIGFVPRVELPSIAAIAIEGPVTLKINCGGGAYNDYLADEGLAPISPAVMQTIYEGLFTRVMRAYPVDYYWIWTPEGWTWEHVAEKTIQTAVEDMQNAIAAADKVKPPFTLATCGWVLGPQNDRALFDNLLPKNMPMSCINRQVGMEPVDRGFLNVSGRPKWSIPWLEDDPAMTSPQLWAGRMRRDAADARAYGCTGLMGIHWRTRILGPTVSALAKAAWDQSYVTASPLAAAAVGGDAQKYPDAKMLGSDDPALYQTTRQGLYAYRLPVPDGDYMITLHSCEPFFAEKGKRVFGVKVEGKLMIENLDVFAIVGANHAFTRAFDNVSVRDGLLDIEFVKHTGLPCIAAIEVAGKEFNRKINCGGDAYKDYEEDLPFVPEFAPTDDFYADWALNQFGPDVADDATAIFAKIDCRLPRPSNWIGGPGGYAPDTRPWAAVREDYEFVDEFAALQPNVKGPGNLERYAYWLANFRYMRGTAEMCCVWSEYNKALERVKAADTPEKKKQIAKESLLDLRKQLIGVVTETYQHLLATVSSAGEMGTIANIEQHTFPGFLEKTGEELAALLGEPLPPDTTLAREYHGPTRVFVPTIRTALAPDEPLQIKVNVLSETTPSEVNVHWRPMGKGKFETIPVSHVARGVWAVSMPMPETELEYYVEVTPESGDAVLWPPTAPKLNQTVVRF